MDVLESRLSLLTRVRHRWAGWPAPARISALVAAALVVLAVTVPVATSRVRGWLTEQRLRAIVDVQATIGVSSSSTSPVGGRVDYFARIRNAGPRPVRVTGLRIRENGLYITARRVPTRDQLAPGSSLFLPLSVRLDCRGRSATGRAAVLPGSVTVRPQGGPWRQAGTSFERATPVTGVAELLCALQPGLRDEELSGPVLDQLP